MPDRRSPIARSSPMFLLSAALPLLASLAQASSHVATVSATSGAGLVGEAGVGFAADHEKLAVSTPTLSWQPRSQCGHANIIPVGLSWRLHTAASRRTLKTHVECPAEHVNKEHTIAHDEGDDGVSAALACRELVTPSNMFSIQTEFFIFEDMSSIVCRIL